MAEMLYETEEFAKSARRVLINAGESVSLIAYDPARRLYVFDVLCGHDTEDKKEDGTVLCADCGELLGWG